MFGSRFQNWDLRIRPLRGKFTENSILRSKIISPDVQRSTIRKFDNILFVFVFFPNRGGTTIRVLIVVKEETLRKHTVTVSGRGGPEPARSNGTFENSSGFSIKIKIYNLFYMRKQFATVKIMVRAFFQFNEGNYMFFSHYRRRREPPVLLSIGCFRSSCLQNSTVVHKATKLQR